METTTTLSKLDLHTLKGSEFEVALISELGEDLVNSKLSELTHGKIGFNGIKLGAKHVHNLETAIMYNSGGKDSIILSDGAMLFADYEISNSDGANLHKAIIETLLPLRLTLADLISYALKRKPEILVQAIIDLEKKLNKNTEMYNRNSTELAKENGMLKMQVAYDEGLVDVLAKANKVLVESNELTEEDFEEWQRLDREKDGKCSCEDCLCLVDDMGNPGSEEDEETEDNQLNPIFKTPLFTFEKGTTPFENLKKAIIGDSLKASDEKEEDALEKMWGEGDQDTDGDALTEDEIEDHYQQDLDSVLVDIFNDYTTKMQFTNAVDSNDQSMQGQVVKLLDTKDVQKVIQRQINVMESYGRRTLMLSYAYSRPKTKKGEEVEKVYTKEFHPIRFEKNKNNHYLVAIDLEAGRIRRYLNLDKIRIII